MPYPRLIRNGLTPAEVEFIAENETITIVPLHRMGTLQLINGSYGPFKPPIKHQVPLWLALTLKRKQKCLIQPPEWLDVAYLRTKLEQETSGENFSDLPFRFMEVSHALLDCAADDVPQADMVRTLLKDLREVRQAKARRGLQAINPRCVEMNNLGMMELNEIRPFFTKAFNELKKLRKRPPGDSQPSQHTNSDQLGQSQRTGNGLSFSPSM
ncbi:DNA replication protein PSF2 [Spizellomyces punctatus DAOM BR117]|uniref:DNA replication complex GINS protein PSF2 n=1 Tax=Spizellomyces punctatus (strain DAOM BR117) TaxID=645134 RepID=A0A0L0H5G9_SPIPD|nr:DNA replication protein PSF2 [Spizellomyces punctatus DAOM BR117]KNC96146.1 hypothetical protein SPPG_08534 [Spizellomyces punctatus DAOM BR117]|eukprot:XP_016604186.1 hypothetical protein SPPG_08534 [Spizellomyces punctatus DAOM BR117]